MLREDKTAKIEKVVVNRLPIHETRPRPLLGQRRSLSQFVANLRPPKVVRWEEVHEFELSSGKRTTPSGGTSRYLFARLSPERFAKAAANQQNAPVHVMTAEAKGVWWWYLDKFYWDDDGLSPADVQALVLHREKKKQAELNRARATLLGEARQEVVRGTPRREPIPEAIRHEVWRRDGGVCVDCGSRERLEFDHIIPVSKGGANTVRNLELRCEVCNRSKGAKI